MRWSADFRISKAPKARPDCGGESLGISGILKESIFESPNCTVQPNTPSEALIAIFNACHCPTQDDRIICTDSNSEAICKVASLEPSSTTMISSAGRV